MGSQRRSVLGREASTSEPERECAGDGAVKPAESAPVAGDAIGAPLPPTGRRETFALSAVLLLYGNLSALVETPPWNLDLWANLALLAIILGWMTRRGYGIGELGLGRTSLGKGVALGVAGGVGVAAIPVVFILLAPLVTGDPIRNEGITSLSGADLFWRLAVRVPLGTAFFEEAAYRGALYASFFRWSGSRGAIIGTSLVFTFWHVVVSSLTVAGSGLAGHPAMVFLGVMLSLAGVLAGGVIFAALRCWTRGIAAAASLHWAVVAMMTAAIWGRA